MKVKSTSINKKYIFVISFAQAFDSEENLKKFYFDFCSKVNEVCKSNLSYLVTLDKDGDLDLKDFQEVMDAKKILQSSQAEGQVVFSIVTNKKDLWDKEFSEISSLSKNVMMVVGSYPKFEDSFVQNFYKKGTRSKGFGIGDMEDWDEFILSEDNWPFNKIGEETLNVDYYPDFKESSDGISSSNLRNAVDKKEEEEEEEEEEHTTLEFSCQEVTFAVFTYSPKEFGTLKIKKITEEWIEELNSNGSSYPLYVGSRFDKNGTSVPVSSDDELEEDVIYVIPHYYYQTADYSSTEAITRNCEIKLAEVGGLLIPEMPMSHVVNGDESIEFECQGTTDGTDFAVYVFWNSKLIAQSEIEAIDSQFIKDVLLLAK
jgi:hypothetical protein